MYLISELRMKPDTTLSFYYDTIFFSFYYDNINLNFLRPKITSNDF